MNHHLLHTSTSWPSLRGGGNNLDLIERKHRPLGALICAVITSFHALFTGFHVNLIPILRLKAACGTDFHPTGKGCAFGTRSTTRHAGCFTPRI